MKFSIFLFFVLIYQPVISQIKYNTKSKYYTTTKKSVEVLTNVNCDSLTIKLFEEINLYRTQNGLNQLVLSQDAINYSKSHVDFLTTTKSYNHSEISKSNFVLENLNMLSVKDTVLNFDKKWVESTPTMMLNSWKKSRDHNSNLLNKNITRVGISFSSVVYTEDNFYVYEMKVVMVAN